MFVPNIKIIIYEQESIYLFYCDFPFLNKAASYGQEIQVSRDTVKVSVQEGNTSPHNERSITPKPLDIRKAVDLSSGSCPSRITFDVQNPYNPTFPTDKSPLHEGEYSTSGIIKAILPAIFTA